MKKFLIAIVVLAAIAGGVYLNLGSAAKRLIEQAGTAALGTPVHVSDFSFSLSDKTASMGHLVIDNPKSFGGALLATKSISFTVGDISKTLVVLNEVVVDGMDVSYTMGTGGTNFDAMRGSMKSSAHEGGASSVAAPKLVIKKLKIENAQMTAAVQGLGGKAVPIPDITLTDVGSKSKPATAAEAAGQIMDRILNAGTNALMKNKLVAPISDAVGKGKDKLQDMFK